LGAFAKETAMSLQCARTNEAGSNPEWRQRARAGGVPIADRAASA
jgi:hypothetical protein